MTRDEQVAFLDKLQEQNRRWGHLTLGELIAKVNEQYDEIERLRERVKDAEKAMEPHWESKSVQDYYKKHTDPVDANIEPCDQ
jgi:hypothetical protein